MGSFASAAEPLREPSWAVLVLSSVPKGCCQRKGIDPLVLPPSSLVAMPVQLAMMPAAQRDGELIAHFSAQGSRSSDLQMMGVAWALLADRTGLRGDKCQMRLAAPAGRFRQGRDLGRCDGTQYRVGRGLAGLGIGQGRAASGQSLSLPRPAR